MRLVATPDARVAPRLAVRVEVDERGQIARVHAILARAKLAAIAA